MSNVIGEHRLWYLKPAKEWEEALPLGNGRIGAMVFGDTLCERICLNEDTLWSGYPRNTNVDSAQYYQEAQNLALEGKYHEAQQLIEEKMEGKFTQSYMPLGDLHIDFANAGEATDYTRSLNMQTAMTTTEFSVNETRYKGECFVSHPAQALVYKLSSDKAGGANVRISFSCRLKSHTSAAGNLLILGGTAPSHAAPSYLHNISDDEAVTYENSHEGSGMRFFAVAQVEAQGGALKANGRYIEATGADSVLIKLCARTSFAGFDTHPYLDGIDEKNASLFDLQKIASKSYDELLSEHIADFSPLFSRVDFHITRENTPDIPTDERLLRFIQTQNDPALYELIFHYGRYLMLTSSRPGTQATNLQGIWNKDIRPAWSSNYTININTQMNYWPAEPMAMGDMHAPLFDLIEKLMVTGAKSAQASYGAGGSVSHHNTDIWGLANVVGENRRGFAGCAFWPMSFGWLCRHMFEHYEYSMDKDFLKKRALPAIKKACEFYLDVMRKNENGYYIITPATSPENAFTYDDKKCHVARSAAMSSLIVRECFENYMKCMDVVGKKDELYNRIAEALPLIMPCEIGSQGQLLEWNGEFDEPEIHHRHVSHLYGLYPGDMTSLESSPELAQACRRSLEIRGDDGTGWSLGWKINLWARLREGDHALKLLKRQLKLVPAGEKREMMSGGGTYLNLFDAHPPFQIDGNFSACCGVGEMLLQCVNGKIIVLPALPCEWESGFIRGIRAKGGYEFDITFDGGAATTVTVRGVAECPSAVIVDIGGVEMSIELKHGEEKRLL